MKAGYDKYSLTFCSTINIVYSIPKIQIVDHKMLKVFLPAEKFFPVVRDKYLLRNFFV